MRRQKSFVLLMTALGAVPLPFLKGQTFRKVTGHVSDPTGGGIIAGQISLTNTATSSVRTASSIDSGDYTFPAMAPGVCNLKVEETSFKSKSGGNIGHGALFEFIRNNQFDAIPYAFTAKHPPELPFKWNDYGFEIDGPAYSEYFFGRRANGIAGYSGSSDFAWS